jgi:hypothetical protein
MKHLATVITSCFLLIAACNGNTSKTTTRELKLAFVTNTSSVIAGPQIEVPKFLPNPQ